MMDEKGGGTAKCDFGRGGMDPSLCLSVSLLRFQIHFLGPVAGLISRDIPSVMIQRKLLGVKDALETNFGSCEDEPHGQ